MYICTCFLYILFSIFAYFQMVWQEQCKSNVSGWRSLEESTCLQWLTCIVPDIELEPVEIFQNA